MRDSIKWRNQIKIPQLQSGTPKNTLKQAFQDYAPGWNFPDDLLEISPGVQCLKLKTKNS